jgi:hypothetical protein
MTILHRVSVFEKSEVGTILIARKRLFFRLFTPLSKNNFIMLFQPNLSGAKWHKLSLEWEDEELDLFMEEESPMSAMAFLRNRSKLAEEQ